MQGDVPYSGKVLKMKLFGFAFLKTLVNPVIFTLEY